MDTLTDKPFKGKYDLIIVGGGFFGAVLALRAKVAGTSNILIIEAEESLMTRASYVNQARVHNGYHYPRSLLTAIRSRVNYPRFMSDYRDGVENGFTKIYAIARTTSKVGANQFEQFCRRIGATIKPAPESLARLFDSVRVESVFEVTEGAFNSTAIAAMLNEELYKIGVRVALGTKVHRFEKIPDGIRVHLECGDELDTIRAINCTYSGINTLLRNSGLDPLGMKHEVAEIALVEPPDELQNIGVTIMDGPFFSCMPFPARRLHSFSHVRYTPHYSWNDLEHATQPYTLLDRLNKSTNFEYMRRDASLFMPCMARARHADSLFEVKTVLLQNEVDDGRPILHRFDYGMPGLSVVMGGKLDNVYDIEAIVSKN